MATTLHSVPVSTLVVDGVVCFASLLACAATMPGLSHGALPGGLDEALPWVRAAAFSLISVFMFACLGLYRPIQLRFQSAAWRAGLAAVLAGAVAYPIFVADIGPSSAEYLLPRAVALVTSALLAYKFAEPRLRKALRMPRVLIVGCGTEALEVGRGLVKSTAKQGQVVGYVAAGPDRLEPEAFGDARVFGDGTSIVDLVHRHGVDEIVVAVRDQRGGGVPMDQLLACRIRGIRVLDLSGYFELAHSEVPLDSLKMSWLVYGGGFEQGFVRRMVKRVVDLIGSIVLLLLLSPIMLLTAILIPLESRGPIIYRQERVGFGGKVFTCMKFRSMCTDAEKDGVARWAAKNDARVTRVGAFIRRTRIDELPQLLSVLRGEMSLIGPRPERPSFVQDLRQKIPFYDLRHSIKPGLTGWAQVRYCYGSSLEDARRKHQFDLYYVKNNSLLLDLLILIETVSVVLFREGQ